jgi:hypothetical protein
MTDILADYREWRAEQEDRIGTHGDRCHMWPRHERCMIHRLARALEAARLTDRGAAGYRLGVRRCGRHHRADRRHAAGTAGADGVTKRRQKEISANISYRSNEA